MKQKRGSYLVNKLNSLDNLLKELANDSVIKRFKTIERIVDNDQSLNKDFKRLLELQKIMVNKREKKSKDLDKAEKEYNESLEVILNHIILSEYLDLLEEVNFDLALIQKIISEEINIDLK